MESSYFCMTVLVFEAFNILIVHSIFTSLFEREKKDRTKRFLIYVAYLLCKSALYFITDFSVVLFLMDIMFLIPVSFFYKGRVVGKVFLSVVLSVVFAVARELPFIMSTDYETALKLLMVIKLVLYIISIILYIVFYYKKSRKNADYDVFLTVIVPILSIELFNVLMSIKDPFWRIISIIVVAVIDLAAFLSYELMIVYNVRDLEKMMLEQENFFYRSQCEIMKKNIEETNAIRHDMNNQLSVLSWLIEEGKEKNVAEQLKTLTGSIQNAEIYSETGNLIIDSMVNYKLRNAASDHIDVDFSASIPEYVEIEEMDMAVILGNLLDNAIEAVNKVAQENRMIRISIKLVSNTFLISISNTYQNVMRDSGGEFVSTKEDAPQHGFGLHNTKRSVEKYHGIMELSVDDSIFTADVILYLRL